MADIGHFCVEVKSEFDGERSEGVDGIGLSGGMKSEKMDSRLR